MKPVEAEFISKIYNELFNISKQYNSKYFHNILPGGDEDIVKMLSNVFNVIKRVFEGNY